MYPEAGSKRKRDPTIDEYLIVRKMYQEYVK